MSSRIVEEMGWSYATATVERSSGPERVSTTKAPEEAPPRRYVGFLEPSPPVEEPVERSNACPGVW